MVIKHIQYLINMNLEERFWSKVEKTDSCWNWKGGKTSAGYGVFRIGKHKTTAHRFAFGIHRIPKGLQIDHLCRNRSCVNPDHLEAVTCRENLLRGNTIPSINSRKTHCNNGHGLAGKNLLMYNGTRYCKKCQIQWKDKNKYRINQKRRERKLFLKEVLQSS